MRRTIKATLTHPTNFFKGEKLFTVCDTAGRKPVEYMGKMQHCVYVSAPEMGCSRDYLVPMGFKGDCEAIRQFVAEHGCKADKLTAIPA